MYALQLVTATINGWGASIFYVAQGKYISEAANAQNVGMFNSVLWVATMATLISGNLVAGFVVANGNQSTLWFVLTALTTLSGLWFLFLQPPKTLKSEKDKDIERAIDKLEKGKWLWGQATPDAN